MFYCINKSLIWRYCVFARRHSSTRGSLQPPRGLRQTQPDQQLLHHQPPGDAGRVSLRLATAPFSCCGSETENPEGVKKQRTECMKWCEEMRGGWKTHRPVFNPHREGWYNLPLLQPATSSRLLPSGFIAVESGADKFTPGILGMRNCTLVPDRSWKLSVNPALQTDARTRLNKFT